VNLAYVILVVTSLVLFAGELAIRWHRKFPVDLQETSVSIRLGVLAYASAAVSQLGLMSVAFWASRRLVPWHLPIWNPLTWIAYILIDDFSGYWMHRASHRFRFLWSAHLVHHSAKDLSLANAARLSPVEALYQPMVDLWAPFLGFPLALYAPVTVFSLVLLELQHTRVIGKLGWADRWLNTPSNHRAHHGKNPVYLDRNFGAWTMLWDRLFGTYVEEEETVVFGVTDRLVSSGVFGTALGGYPALVRDLSVAPTLTTAVQVALAPPGRFGRANPSHGATPLHLPEISR
jgi:alkylglycerol monooxygenase